VGELADTGGPGSRDGEVDDPDVVERQRHRSGPRRPQAWGMPLPATSCPPSVVMTSPTVYAPAREERKMQRPAMSSGVPTRPRGLPRPTRSQSVPSTSPPVPTPVESIQVG